MHVPRASADASRARQRALSGSKAGDNGSGSPGHPRASGFARAWLQYREFAFRNSWFNPLLLLLFLGGWWFVAAKDHPDHWLNMFVKVSYPIPGTDPVQYGKGKRDFAFVAFYVIFFTFWREFWMQVVLRRLALYFGLRKKGKINRFMEQTYCIVYYGISGPFGLYIMKQLPLWYFNTTAFYENYPHKTHDLLFKCFYLLQAAFWAQQSLVLALQLEKPRKDFKELVFHHIVTIALIFLSYRFHFTWMGIAIYVTMDISDFFLAMSKTLNYIDSILVAPFFGLFALVWIYLRHYLNILILWSCLTEFRTVGDYTLNWDTQQYKCWISQIITFSLILALQLVNIYWLFLIMRIAYRLVVTKVAEDVRSEDEDSDEEPDPADKKKTN